MSQGLLHLLLLLSLPMFAGLGWAGLLISNAQAREARLAARVASLTEAGRVPGSGAPARIARAVPRARSGRLTDLLKLAGCDYERREIYPLPWWVVILVAIILGRFGVMLAAVLLGKLAFLAWPLIAIFLCRTAFGQWEGKRRDTLLKQFPDALAMVVRAVRVGVPVTEAIRLVGRESAEPTGAEFGRLADAIAIGTPLDAALRDMAQRTGLPEYRFFATALTLQAQAGGTLSESLEMLADVIRKRVSLKARGYALTSEGRTSTIVLCAMPFVIAGMLLVLNPSYIMVLFRTEIGHKMLMAGLLMLITAIFTMRKMIRATLA